MPLLLLHTPRSLHVTQPNPPEPPPHLQNHLMKQRAHFPARLAVAKLLSQPECLCFRVSEHSVLVPRIASQLCWSDGAWTWLLLQPKAAAAVATVSG